MLKKELLQEIWKLCNLEEIITAGLECGKLTSPDIIHASDIYKDPDKEWEDDEIKEIISSRGIRDIMDIIQDEYNLSDILDCLPSDEILDNMDEDDMLYKLEGSWTLSNHDDEVKSEYYNDIYDEIAKDIDLENKMQVEKLKSASPDFIHQFICDYFGIGRYDTDSLKEKIKKFREYLNKNNYDINY